MFEVRMDDGSDIIAKLEEIAGLKLGPEQRKQFSNILADLQGSDPETIARAIEDELKRIANIALSSIQFQSLALGIKSSPYAKRKEQRSKWEILKEMADKEAEEESRAAGPSSKPSVIAKQEATHRLTDEQIAILTATAAKKLEVQLDNEQHQQAIDFVKKSERENPELTDAQKTNMILFGVIDVTTLGSGRLIVEYYAGNPNGIIDFDNTDDALGMSPINQENRFDTSYAGGDPQGYEFQVLLHMLNSGEINRQVMNELEGLTAENTEGGTASHTSPRLTPFRGTSTNPFEE